jgi:hypothetical protein
MVVEVEGLRHAREQHEPVGALPQKEAQKQQVLTHLLEREQE